MTLWGAGGMQDSVMFEVLDSKGFVVWSCSYAGYSHDIVVAAAKAYLYAKHSDNA